MFSLAEVLHKTVAEIAEMTDDEFRTWCVYLRQKPRS